MMDSQGFSGSPSARNGVGAKPELWTLDWTVDWTLDCILDCILDRILDLTSYAGPED